MNQDKRKLGFEMSEAMILAAIETFKKINPTYDDVNPTDFCTGLSHAVYVIVTKILSKTEHQKKALQIIRETLGLASEFVDENNDPKPFTIIKGGNND